MMSYNGKVVSITKHQPVNGDPTNGAVEAQIVSNLGYCEVKVWVQDGSLVPGQRVSVHIDRLVEDED